MLEVLNAFRHQRLLHAVYRAGRQWDARVLNAFRHQRLLHRPPAGFGRGRWIGAQRLSASKIAAQGNPYPDADGQSCSTPFGIKDCCTLCYMHYQRERLGCSTPFGIKDCCTGNYWHAKRRNPSAQRLSASKIAARPVKLVLRYGLRVLNAFRHQRLLHLGGSSTVRLTILCSTPFGIKDCCTAGFPCQSFSISGVLNAFRHQRLLHCGLPLPEL